MTSNRNDITASHDHDSALATMAPDQLAGVVGGALAGSYSPDHGSYTVGRGDNLTKIARANGESLDQLLAANPQFTSGGRNPNLIYPGDQISFGQPAQSAGQPAAPYWFMQALQGLGMSPGR